MKKRLGFVSNSSSSSFVCSVCGVIESGMDASLEDFEMAQCVLDHEFHEGCIESEVVKAALMAHFAKADDEDVDEESDDYIDSYELRHAVPADGCPVCSMSVLLSEDEAAYLRKKLGMTQEAVLAEIKTAFSDYPTFKDAIE